jgi:HSP20 family protein
MNEPRPGDFLAPDPLETSLRDLLRPWRTELAERSPRIRIDLNEVPGAYALKADIPGARKEDIDVRIDGNRVTISAEFRNGIDEKSCGRVLHSECRHGLATRTLALADGVDEAKADARYQDGVLQLTLPKRAPATQKRLSIA